MACVDTCWVLELGLGGTWVGTKADGYSWELRLGPGTGCAELGSGVPQCFAAPLQSASTTAPETVSKPCCVPMTQFTSTPLITRFFQPGVLSTDAFLLVDRRRGGSIWPLLSGWTRCSTDILEQQPGLRSWLQLWGQRWGPQLP